MTEPNLKLQSAILDTLASGPKIAREIAQVLGREECGIESCLRGLRRKGAVAMKRDTTGFKAAYWRRVKA